MAAKIIKFPIERTRPSDRMINAALKEDRAMFNFNADQINAPTGLDCGAVPDFGSELNYLELKKIQDTLRRAFTQHSCLAFPPGKGTKDNE
jgi:hypothetical protein